MVPYHGTLADAHLRAVVRLALRAHGFSISGAAFERAVSEQWRIGTSLRDDAFPERLPGFAGVEDYFHVASADPELWARLPWMAGFGSLGAGLFENPSDSREVGDPVTLLAGAFTTAIVVLDFLADERQMGDRVFEVLDDRTVVAMFGAAGSSSEILAGRYRAEEDVRVRLLLALIGMCGAMGHELLEQSGNVPAWERLAGVVGRMYRGQRKASGCVHPDRGEALDLMPALEAKSALPTVAVSCIAALRPGRVGVPDAWLEVGELLGRLYWTMDDLVDLLDDTYRGVPTPVHLRLADIAARSGRRWATDGDLYDVVDDVSAEIVELLHPDKWARPGRLVPGALELARVRVAAWSRWEEELAASGTQTEVRPQPKGNERATERLRDATAILLDQQRAGYVEAVHHMTFPRAHDGVVRMETHSALLFQRAVILDALLAARDVAEIPDNIIATEAMALLRAKHRGVAGGWSYIPEVQELPPDADDLGAVLLALCRVGGPALAQTCEDAIALALEAAGPDGAFPTWILDPLGQSKADEACRAYLWIGGKGIHPEVVANLLCALHEYDRVVFDKALRRARRFFEATQGEDGFWQSRWYAGPFYGTYRVADVFARVDPSHPLLERTRRSLLAVQRPDGGWGESKSDPLSTSFAALTLVAVGSPATSIAFSRGVGYLVATQEEDGGWPSCLWGAFQTGVGFESHGSRSVTTAYCLRALLAAAATPARPPEARASSLATGSRHAGI